MRHHAKASFAFIYGRSASVAAGRDARSFATRGASRDSDGSGAPLRIRACALAFALVSFAALALAPLAQAGKIVDRIVSGTTTSGTTGGLFNSPRGLAVNYANVADGNGTDGWLYVADDNNHRVQAFDASGVFKFAIGRDVIKAGAVTDTDLGDVFEKCTTASDCKAGSFGTTSDAPTGEFDNPQDVAINQSTGHIYVRDRDNRRVQEFTATGAFVRMWGQDVINGAVANSNGTGFEVCDVTNGNVAADCKQGTTGAAGGQFATSSTASTGISVVPAGASNAGNVVVADPTNRRIQEFTSAGAWVRAWGWDVISPGGTGEVIRQLNEQQTVSLQSVFGIVTGGTFTLSFDPDEGGPTPVQTTPDIPFDASAAAVEAELEALPAIGAGNLNVSGANGGAWTIDFVGAFIGTDVAQLTGDASALTGTGFAQSVQVATTIPGGPAPGFESCTVAAQCKAGAESAPATQDGAFATNNPVHLAIDGDGTVFASDSAVSNRVQRFDSTKAVASELLRSSIAVAALTGTSSTGTTGLGIDPTTDALFVARNSSIGVLELSDPDGSPADADRHYQGAGLTPAGIASDHAGDDLYLSSASGGHRVFAADDDGSPAPVVTISVPANLGAHSATLNGTVTPGGILAVSYRFQYSKDGSTWTDVAPSANIGGGTEPIPVSNEVTGLEANTLYRVRLVTGKGFGNPEVFSSEAVFVTDALPPEVETLDVAARSENSARLAALVNPNGSPTTYSFQWGKTSSYGNQTPLPAGNAGQSGVGGYLVENVSGLQSGTTYHYRVVAQSPYGAATGADRVFTTRSAVPIDARAYEMVTPPFKVTRATGLPFGSPGNNPNPAIVSLDGETAVWNVSFLPLSDDVAGAQTGDKRIIRRTPSGWVNQTRNTLGYIASPEAGALSPAFFTKTFPGGSSGDFETVSWVIRDNSPKAAGLLPVDGIYASRFYTRRDGTGVKGFTSWLTNPERQIADVGFPPTGVGSAIILNGSQNADTAVFNDDGTAMVRSGSFRGLDDTGGDGFDPSAVEQLGGYPGGWTAYVQRVDDPAQLPAARKELLNECTGSVGSGDATEIPARVGSGIATDTIGTQQCEAANGPDAVGTAIRSDGSAVLTGVETTEGAFAVGQAIAGKGVLPGTKVTAVGAGTLTLSAVAVAETGSGDRIDLVASGGTHLTNTRGVTIGGSGGDGNRPNSGTAATALSDDGNRIFFQSPHYKAGVSTGGGSPSPDASISACAAGTGSATACPPQLFVRAYDSSGDPVVRWISRSRSESASGNAYGGAMIAGQQVALMGRGAAFRGASRDGSVVYFESNAPLTPDDPNGTGTPGPKTTGSASSNSWDLYRYELPASLDADPGDGVLTRVSGGPSGTADPSTNTEKGDASLRFHSDDGKRAYFLTTSPIAGADATPPHGGITTPGGGVGNGSTRDLYLFDDNETGAARYKFIARLPYARPGVGIKPEDAYGCSVAFTQINDYRETRDFNSENPIDGNCVHGPADGGAVLFPTTARLTPDDTDDAADVYLYDATTDELIRVSAPPPGALPYACLRDNGEPIAYCNGDLGQDQGNGFFTGPIGSWETNRGWGGMRYYNVARDSDGVLSVYFESKVALLPQDTNAHMDVYQWRNGSLSLISRGSTATNSWFSGNSVDGQDVFFVTGDRIDPREIDPDDMDTYDARIGGGFPYTPPPEPCDVLALRCESEATPGPGARTASSTVLAGQGNIGRQESQRQSHRCPKGKVRRGERCVVKKRAHRRTHKRATHRATHSGRGGVR